MNQIGWLAALLVFVMVAGWIYLANSSQEADANPTVESLPAGGSKKVPPPRFKPAKVKPLDLDQVEMDPDLKIEIVKNELLVTMEPESGRAELKKILGLIDPSSEL